ncbi:hypothetical protein PENTCL1PPCAC_12892, partial [Pristionchus entomophagus]
LFQMADIVEPSPDISSLHLDANSNGPSASKDAQRNETERGMESGLKRLADSTEDAVPKKKTAEQLASTTSGRNQKLKKLLRKEKRQKRRERVRSGHNRAELLALSEKLVERLRALQDREMALTDRAEEKLMMKEESFRIALMQCEKALANDGEFSCEEGEENVTKSLSIHIPEWPCLDVYVQDFALDRFYAMQHRGKGVSMTTSELIEIINKVRSREPTIGLPTEKDAEALERLLIAINWRIKEAVSERRFDELTKNLEEFPGVDADSIPNPTVEVKIEEDGEMDGVVSRVIAECIASEGGTDGKDVIDLDEEKEEERDKDADEDEFNEEEEDDEEGAKESEDDEQLLGTLGNQDACEADQGKKKDIEVIDIDDSSDEEECNVKMEQDEEMPAEGTEKSKEASEIIDTVADDSTDDIILLD